MGTQVLNIQYPTPSDQHPSDRQPPSASARTRAGSAPPFFFVGCVCVLPPPKRFLLRVPDGQNCGSYFPTIVQEAKGRCAFHGGVRRVNCDSGFFFSGNWQVEN